MAVPVGGEGGQSTPANPAPGFGGQEYSQGAWSPPVQDAPAYGSSGGYSPYPAVPAYGGYPGYQQGYGGMTSVAGPPGLLMYEVDYPQSLSRGLIFIKWLLAFPQAIVLMLFALGMYVVTFISWWAILITGRYPPGLFNFAVNFFRFSANVTAYTYLLRDEYPPFNGVEGNYPPVRVSLGYTEPLSRWKIFVKGFMALPHFVILYFMQAAAQVVLFIAFFAILFTGRFPEGMFRFMVGALRWQYRVMAFVLLLTDRYPPFSLDPIPSSG